jgi:hypothetical protein
MAGSTVSSSDNVVYKTVLRRVEEWRKEQLLKIMEGYKAKNICSAAESRLIFRLPPNKTLSLKVDPCNGGKTPRRG